MSHSITKDDEDRMGLGSPPSNDFEIARSGASLHEETPTKLAGDDFPTLSPLLRVYLRKLWVTGFSENLGVIALECKRLDSRAKPDEVISYIKCHTVTEDWMEERVKFLETKYEQLLKSEEQLCSPIDNVYDKTFDKLRITGELEAERILKRVMEDPTFEVKSSGLKTLVSVMKELHGMQRLARGMTSEKKEVSLNVTDDSALSSAFKDRLEKMMELIEAKTIEVKPLSPL